jgi:cytoskeletal protein CcmA (bactofilin family)
MKKNKTKLLSAIFGALILIPGIAFAYDIKLEENSNTITKDEVIEDDVIITGETVTVDGTVNGDLKAFAANVTINGDINGNVIVVGSNVKINGLVFGDLMVAGGIVELEGEVTDDLMAAGGTINIDGEVRDNVMMAGGMINVSERGKIGRDLLVGGGMVNLSGTVKRNVTFGAGQITVLGKIGGNLNGEANDKVLIEPGAEIDGNLEYKAPQEAEIKDGATIIGEKKWEEIEDIVEDNKSLVSDIFGNIFSKIYSGLSLLVVAIVVILLFPKRSEEVANNINTKPGRSFLYGLGLLIVAPIIIIILAITILGIPLAIILGITYGVLFYISKIYTGLWIGNRILEYFNSKNKKKYKTLILPTVLGLFILWILFLIPFIGGLVKISAVIFGMGAMLVCIINYYNKNKSEKKKEVVVNK